MIATSLDNYPMNSASKYFTHWANGHYWVAFDHGAIPGCSFYSSPDGTTWTFRGNLFAGINPVSITNQWAVRYLGNTVIAAAFNNPNTRTYRSGTLNSDGTVTWSAESPAGPNDATFGSLNLLIANGRPIMWRDDATAGGAGALWRGSAIASPTWTKTAFNAPAMSVAGASNGIFTAGALFPTGGANPDDLIVLRATTVTPHAAGSHRLVAMRWNAATDTYDASWYNVSTLGGGLPEDLTTEVQVNADDLNQRTFAAVRDSSGNIHAVYVNGNGDMVHYRKAVGFNNSWSRVSAGINPPAENIDMVALTAAAGGNLYLFYSKSDKVIYYRGFDGAAWGAESLLQDLSATDLRNALAPMELGVGCSVGLAFVEGAASPFKIRFTLGVGSCATLQTTEPSGSTLTVTGAGQFEMVFNTLRGGGIDDFFDLAEDPTRTLDLAGKDSINLWGLFHSSMEAPATVLYTTGTNSTGAKLDLLEATATRVKVRQESFFQRVLPATAILPGVKGIGDYSVYGQRVALRWNRRITAAVPDQDDHALEITAHREAAGVLNPMGLYSQSGSAFPAPATDDFVLAQREVAGAPGVRTDFLGIQSSAWAAADSLTASITGSYFSWRDTTDDQVLGAGLDEKWNFLIYYKPTNLLDNTDPAVTMRSSDYRIPSAVSVGPGAQWQDAAENTSAAGDFFNESEAAYVFDLNPATGLSFDLDGSGTTRYSPFFKIRQWRSPNAPQTISVDGLTKTRDVHYKADVKPVVRAHFAQDLRWHSTLQDSAAVGSPDVGGSGFVVGPPGFVASRYGSGVSITADTQYVALPTTDLNPAAGALEFWLQPNWDSTDSLWHDICGFYFDAGNFFYLDKESDNALHFRIQASGAYFETKVDSPNFSWRTSDWVHLRIEWDESAPPATQLRLLVNGVEPPNSDIGGDYVGGALTLAGRYRFGNSDGDVTFCDCVFDEIHLYGGSSTTPTALARGGLTSDASEYLADPANNYPLGLAGVDASRRGRYLSFGADSKFRGLNVVLSTAGAGVAAGAMVWQYWNGTTGAWADLEVGGFTDQTNSFVKNGTVFWTSDPAGWAPYSVNGGPDLYYVRAHLPNLASYSTTPVESRITTDVLLFQYCGDVTTNSTFAFSMPATAVRLMAFTATGADGAVDLSWQTGSEVDNLGFHVYRSLAADSPWTRLTSSLIPGQGFSAMGASYTWRDSGLSNGTRYFYRLEDVDSKSVSAFHGPVSAVPQAGAAPAPPPSEGGGSSGSGGSGSGGSGSGSGSSTSAPSCPSWALAQLGSSASYTCETHGDPTATSFRVLSRSSRSVLVELQTEGFLTARDTTGRVRALLPGFDSLSDPLAPALPLKRARLDGAVGRQARIGSIQARENRFFSGLVAAAVGYPQAVVAPDGTVNPGRREAELLLSRGAFPRVQARLGGESFQGEDKTLALELMPLRYDASRGALVLSRRLTVRVDFAGAEPSEVGRGRLGRRLPGTRPDSSAYAFLATSQKGLHSVAFEALFPGRSRPLDLASLRLTTRTADPSSPVSDAAPRGDSGLDAAPRGDTPFFVLPQGPTFGPGGRLFFHVDRTASSTSFSAETVFALERGSAGVRMALGNATADGSGGVSSRGVASFETNRLYAPDVLDIEDLWQWESLGSGVSKTKTFALDGLDPSSPETARLVVYLQGGSDAVSVVDHHVQVFVKDVLVAEESFDGAVPHRVEADVPVSLLQETGNELRLTNVGDTGVSSRVFLDRFELLYPQGAAARSGSFDGVFSISGTAEVAGIASPAALLDVTSGASWLTGYEAGPSLRFRAETGHRYLAVSPEALLSPRVFFPEPTARLRNKDNQADYVLVAPRAFLDAAEPLLERRQAQGLATFAVSLEEIASSFGGGQASAEAIRDFLSFAYHQWRRPSPRYVLLLGDANYDPRHFNPVSQPSPMPFLLQRTSYIWTASDPALVALNGDDPLPDLAIGRLPATTVEQAQTMVAKILDWEAQGQNLDGTAALVADNPDLAGDFEADARDIETSFLAGRDTTEVFLGQLPNRDVARSQILDAFNQGLSLISYVGHGGGAVWAGENILNSSDPAALLAQPRQPFMLTMNCLNGYFIAPFYESLAEGFLKAPGKGTIAAFSPSGLSLDGPAHLYHRAVMQEITSGQHPRLGDAILAAQKTYAQTGAFPELLSLYHLFGDPALRIR